MFEIIKTPTCEKCNTTFNTNMIIIAKEVRIGKNGKIEDRCPKCGTSVSLIPKGFPRTD